MTDPRRGEVWIAHLDPVKGHEQAGRRPVLVLTSDVFNTSGAELATILPITTKLRHFPSRIPLTVGEGGLKRVSYVIGEQPRTISTERLEKALGHVSTATMVKVGDAVRILLGL